MLSILFISALTGQRAHKVLEMAKECYDNYSKRVSTGVLNDVISKASTNERTTSSSIKEIKNILC